MLVAGMGRKVKLSDNEVTQHFGGEEPTFFIGRITRNLESYEHFFEQRHSRTYACLGLTKRMRYMDILDVVLS